VFRGPQFEKRWFTGFNAKDIGPTRNTKCPGYLKTDKLESADNFGTRGTEYLQEELGSTFR